MWAWVRAAGRTPRPAAQVRKASAWMNRVLAYWQAVARSGPAAALARIAGQLVPQPELAQQPQVRVPGQAVQPPVQPRLELAQLLVGGGQHAAVHQQVTQVEHGPRAGPGVQRLVGERQLAGGQVREQVADVRSASSHSSVAAGLGAAARASASGFSGGATAPVPSSSSRAAVQVTAHGPQSRLRPRRRPGPCRFRCRTAGRRTRG